MPTFATDPIAGLRLGFHGLPETPELHLSVDGMTPAGPNLSHWPGNRTPPQWRRDLSTSIGLAFAGAAPAEQREFLRGATTVLNDHYDTDGFGSLLAVLRPATAFAREELLLTAAATGDFGQFTTWRAFAIDRIVANLAAPASPVAREFVGRAGAYKSFERYRWLLEHAATVLDRPESFAVLYEDELALVRGELAAGHGGALQRRVRSDLGFSIVTTRAPVHRMTLNTLAGAFRVLHVVDGPDGRAFRYHDRTETWFELATIVPPARIDLRPVAARLDALEPTRDGAQWCADPPTEPIPELYFGLPAVQDYGEVSRVLQPSRLTSAQVAGALAAAFAAAPATA